MSAVPPRGAKSALLTATIAGILLLVVVVVAGGCGGSSETFSGPREQTDGSKVEQLSGVSFAHPANWNVETRSVGKSGGMVVVAKAPDMVGNANPTASLTRWTT